MCLFRSLKPDNDVHDILIIFTQTITYYTCARNFKAIRAIKFDFVLIWYSDFQQKNYFSLAILIEYDRINRSG